MHIKIWNIALLFLLFAAFSGCGDESNNTATLRFKVEFDDVTVIRRAQETSGDSEATLYDLNQTGMIGKLIITGSEIQPVEVYFPEAGYELEGDAIEVEAEIEAGLERKVSGVFFLSEQEKVKAFNSQDDIAFSISAGQEKEIALSLYEADTGSIKLELAGEDTSDFVRAFPVESSVGVIFPPADFSPEINGFLFENIPLGFQFWFRLENKNGEFSEIHKNPPYSAETESAE